MKFFQFCDVCSRGCSLLSECFFVDEVDEIKGLLDWIVDFIWDCSLASGFFSVGLSLMSSDLLVDLHYGWSFSDFVDYLVLDEHSLGGWTVSCICGNKTSGEAVVPGNGYLFWSFSLLIFDVDLF